MKFSYKRGLPRLAVVVALLTSFAQADHLELRILSFDYDPAAESVSVTWTSQSGLSYALQYSDDLQQNWLDVDDVVATGPEATMTHPGVDGAKRFYRVVQFE